MIGWIYSLERGEWVKHSPVIVKWEMWILAARKHIEWRQVSEAFAREQTTLASKGLDAVFKLFGVSCKGGELDFARQSFLEVLRFSEVSRPPSFNGRLWSREA